MKSKCRLMQHTHTHTQAKRKKKKKRTETAHHAYGHQVVDSESNSPFRHNISHHVYLAQMSLSQQPPWCHCQGAGHARPAQKLPSAEQPSADQTERRTNFRKEHPTPETVNNSNKKLDRRTTNLKEQIWESKKRGGDAKTKLKTKPKVQSRTKIKMS